MTISLTIRNAEVVLPRSIQRTDISVIDGKINAIGHSIPEVGEVLDAEGLILLPGIVDPQVHFREPGSEYKEDLHSGSCAAAAGGVTSFLDMPNNNPPVITRKSMTEKKKLAAEKSVVNYGFFIGATPENLIELNSVENVCGIKIFMGSSTGNLLVDNPKILEKIFSKYEVLQKERVIAYCGGGIAATNIAFVLTALGYINVSVYDASLSEWAKINNLPMSVD